MNILPNLLALIGLLLAIVVGTLIAEGRNSALIICFALPFFFFYIKTVGAYWIFIGLFYATVGLDIQPIGPRLEPIHIVLALACIYLLANFWRNVSKNNINNSIQYFKPFLISYAGLIVYIISASFLNTIFPHAYMGDATRNLLKQQTSIGGSFLIIAITLLFHKRFAVVRNPVVLILSGIAVGLIFNIALRLYGIFILKIGEIDVVTGMEIPHNTFFIPIINASDNIFILRFLGPLSCCVAVSVLTSKCNQLKKISIRFLSFFVLIFGLLGCLVSQGRATLLLCFGMISLVLLARKKIGFLLFIFSSLFVFILTVKVAYEYDSRLVPAAVQRSLGWLPFMQTSHMRGSIDSSTNWRIQLFESAIDEISSSRRILLFGRGVYAFTERDAAILRIDGWDGAIEVARRRGASHNLFTDIILTNGVVGLVVYLLTYATLLWGLFKVWKNSANDIPQGDLALACLSSLTMSLAISLVGGGFPQTIDSLIVGIVVLMNRGIIKYKKPTSDSPFVFSFVK